MSFSVRSAIAAFAAFVGLSCVSGQTRSVVSRDAAGVAPRKSGAFGAAVIDVERVSARERAEPEVLVAPSGTKPLVLFEAVHAELDKRCTRRPSEDTNFATKEAFGAKVECLQREVDASRRELLASPLVNDAERSDLTAYEAANDALEAKMCWMSEEAAWVDFESGVRDSGSLSTYMYMECEEASRFERTYLLRSMKSGDVAGIVERIRALQAKGGAQRVRLNALLGAARALSAKPIPAASGMWGPYPLSGQARSEYVGGMEQIARGVRAQAHSTCKLFTGLPDALGGDSRCEAHVATYIFSFARLQGIGPAEDSE